MKKIRFYLILLLVTLAGIIIILTSVFIVIYIRNLTNLYFKYENENYKTQKTTISIQEIDKAIEKLKKFGITQ